VSSVDALNASLAQLTSNNLGIRLANGDPGFVDASQALRYRVFYEEMTAHPSPETARSKRDVDTFDDVADHLLVVDRNLGDGPESVVGTYRLVRREAAARHGQFYSVDEYDISALVNLPGEILELGRSCVDINYRSRHVMDLLWRGIAAYVFHYDITIMFGCASFSGVDPDAIALPLSYLYQNHLAPIEKRPIALPDRYVDMNRLPADSFEKRKGLAAVPPLIKGYLRLGGYIGDGAVIDPQFDTIDVCIVVETDLVTDRYYNHYVRKTGESGNDERNSSQS
jgi:putative hemolysin